METLDMLQALASTWGVELCSIADDSGVWELTITNGVGRSFQYTGTDLKRVVRAAWAGEPAGRV